MLTENPQKSAIVVVDPISTGANFAESLLNKGENVIRLWSNNVSEVVMKLIAPGLRSDFSATLKSDPTDVDVTIASLNALPYKITSVVAGSEPAVELADEISEKMCLPTNGTELSDYRRDKYSMGERVRESGVRAVRQKRCSTWTECQEFIAEQPQPFQLVIKPARSSGSDDVFKVSTLEAAEEKFNFIMGKKNKLGIENDCVLVQELLVGDEYVIDTVSLNGHHKLAGSWKYVKGSANGADFVYFGMVIVDGNDPVVQEVFEYTKKVLDALGIRNFAGHAEVMYNPQDGPCLVEVGSRPHGGEGIFIPVALRCCDYSVIELLTAAARGEEEFNAYPDLWTVKNGFGAVIDLVSFTEGTVTAYDEYSHSGIKSLPSFLDFKCLPEIGAHLSKTIDCFTAAGCVLLFHPDEAQVRADIAEIRDFERTLFVTSRN